LYERCGFRAFGTEPMAIATSAGYKAKVHMWLSMEGPLRPNPSFHTDALRLAAPASARR